MMRAIKTTHRCVCIECEVSASINESCRKRLCWGDGPGGTYLNGAGETVTCMCAATGHTKVPALVREFSRGKQVVNATDLDAYVAQNLT